MKIKILSNLEYQTFPETEDMIEIENEELLERIGIDKQFINNKIVDYVREETPEEKIYRLKDWFNTYYTVQEQKLRRLHTLQLLCDDGTSPYYKLIDLYNLAEKHRKEIQELEKKV